jgi:hypothetical protein
MSSAFTTSELQLEGIVLAPFEAVAVVLSLMDGQHPHDEQDAPSRPSLSTLYVTRDGDVYSKTSGTLSINDLGLLLKQMLERTPQVPPGLLFAIARALRAVEAPPFESADAFARILARFERGPRRDVVSSLVARFEAALDSKPAGAPRVERRGTPRLVSHLRQELRAADRHLYEKRIVVVPVVQRTLLAPPPSRALKHFGLTAMGVCFVAALGSFAMGDSLHGRPQPTPVHQPVVAAARSGDVRLVPAISTPPPAPAPAPARRTRAAAVHPNSNRSSRLLTALRFRWLRRLTFRNNL